MDNSNENRKCKRSELTYKVRSKAMADINKLDILDREKVIDELFRIVQGESINQVFCSFAIDGTWGVGKTFILERLEQKLEMEMNEETSDNRYFVFHYNCWKYDYYEEPAIAIISALKDKVDIENKICSVVASYAWKEAKKSVENMAKEFVKNKIGIDLVQVIEDIKSEGDIRQEKESEFDTLFNFNRALENVRKQIEKLAEYKTMIIVVDELDRCMPAYAIKILERLHHMFEGIDNVLVIIAVDSNQLNHSIKEIYGDLVDTERYLKKIISFKYNIDIGMAQKSIMDKFQNYFGCFSEYLQIDETITEFLQLSQLDVRTIEKIIEKSQLIHGLVCDREVSSSVLLYEIMYSFLSYLVSNSKVTEEVKTSYGTNLYWVPDINVRTYVDLNEYISDEMLKFLKDIVTGAVGSTMLLNEDLRSVNMNPEGKCIGYMDVILANKKKLYFEDETEEIKYELEVCKRYGEMFLKIS